MPENPYQPPQEVNEPASFGNTSPIDLESRVAELERRVGQSWFLDPGFLRRVIAVWGYVLIGYLMLWAIAGPIVLILVLLEWLFP
jgi:hypothetical protein